MEIKEKPKYSWKRVGKVSGSIVLIGLILAGGYAVATSRRGKIAWASWTRDARENFLPCEDLPFNVQVKKAMEDHPDMVRQIEQITGTNPQAHEIRCQIIPRGNEFIKGEIQISYRSKKERKEIEKLIGDNFFGIPWEGKQVGN